jgi:hypothetical protein
MSRGPASLSRESRISGVHSAGMIAGALFPNVSKLKFLVVGALGHLGAEKIAGSGIKSHSGKNKNHNSASPVATEIKAFSNA